MDCYHTIKDYLQAHRLLDNYGLETSSKPDYETCLSIFTTTTCDERAFPSALITTAFEIVNTGDCDSPGAPLSILPSLRDCIGGGSLCVRAGAMQTMASILRCFRRLSLLQKEMDEVFFYRDIPQRIVTCADTILHGIPDPDDILICNHDGFSTGNSLPIARMLERLAQDKDSLVVSQENPAVFEAVVRSMAFCLLILSIYRFLISLPEGGDWTDRQYTGDCVVCGISFSEMRCPYGIHENLCQEHRSWLLDDGGALVVQGSNVTGGVPEEYLMLEPLEMEQIFDHKILHPDQCQYTVISPDRWWAFMATRILYCPEEAFGAHKLHLLSDRQRKVR